jgi:predicted RNase H-like HicB family nuclease
VPALPGCATCGDTIEEVRDFLREAAEGYLAVLHDENAPGVTARLIEDSGAAEATRAAR